jgi:CPA1 family monovalent cation:H+ antiporter
MRGLVTLATAFALPADFPQRDIVVLTAFAVVLATLVFQGLTLAPVIRWLGLDRRGQGAEELTRLRRRIAQAGIARLDNETDPDAERLRDKFRLEQEAYDDPTRAASVDNYRRLVLTVIAGQRAALEELRIAYELTVDEYNLLLEEIDWRELSVLPEDARRIEET